MKESERKYRRCIATGLSNMADEIAIYAYYSLVLGVVLQIASYIKYRPKEEQS